MVDENLNDQDIEVKISSIRSITYSLFIEMHIVAARISETKSKIYGDLEDH